MMSRAAVAAHARWCHRLLRAGERDVFANHAPFHFAMSLFDIYSSSAWGARLVLVPDEVRQFAPHVVDLLSRERVTIFFAAPSILSLIAALDDLESRDLTALASSSSPAKCFPRRTRAAPAPAAPPALLQLLGLDGDQRRRLLRDSSRRGARRPAADRPPVRALRSARRRPPRRDRRRGHDRRAPASRRRPHDGLPEPARAERRAPARGGGRRAAVVSHLRPGGRAPGGRPPLRGAHRPHGEAARLSRRAGRDRDTPLPAP